MHDYDYTIVLLTSWLANMVEMAVAAGVTLLVGVFTGRTRGPRSRVDGSRMADEASEALSWTYDMRSLRCFRITLHRIVQWEPPDDTWTSRAKGGSRLGGSPLMDMKCRISFTLRDVSVR